MARTWSPLTSGTNFSNSRVTTEPWASRLCGLGVPGKGLDAPPPPEIWICWYHFPFFLGPPLISRTMSLSVILTSVMTHRSPGLAAAPNSETCWAMTMSDGVTTPFLILSPLSPWGNNTRAKTRSDCRLRMTMMRVWGVIFSDGTEAAGFAGLGVEVGAKPGAEAYAQTVASSSAVHQNCGWRWRLIKDSVWANYKPNCGGG